MTGPENIVENEPLFVLERPSFAEQPGSIIPFVVYIVINMGTGF